MSISIIQHNVTDGTKGMSIRAVVSELNLTFWTNISHLQLWQQMKQSVYY